MMHLFCLADFLLLITTLIWGWSFIIVKWSITTIDLYFFIFSRFLLAFLMLTLIYHNRLRNFRQNMLPCLKPGITLGLILGLAFITQTLGLKYTTPATSGFITGMSVVMVTVLASVIYRRLPRKIVLIGIIAATIGLLIISSRSTPLTFSKGDFLTLICAVLFAVHIVYTGSYARNLSAGLLAIVQFATVMCMSGIAFLLWGHLTVNPVTFSPGQWLAIIYSGVLATGIAYFLQTKAQQKLPANRTAILLATEPLFAGIFAISLGLEPLTPQIFMGGLCILAGMVLSGWDVNNSDTDIKIISTNK